MSELYCEHQHLADSCERCAYSQAKLAGLPVTDALFVEGGESGGTTSIIGPDDAVPPSSSTAAKRSKR